MTHYRPLIVRDLPCEVTIAGRVAKPHLRPLVDTGVLRIIAGHTLCHVWIDLKIPYSTTTKSQSTDLTQWREPI